MICENFEKLPLIQTIGCHMCLLKWQMDWFSTVKINIAAWCIELTVILL